MEKSISALIRQSGAEGCVLLKNDCVLPLAPSTAVAVFGVGQIFWFDMGYGSGGDVLRPYSVNLLDALESGGKITVDIALSKQYHDWCNAHPVAPYEWGTWPRRHRELPLNRETVEISAKRCQTAVIVIGRNEGESFDLALEKGSYFLADDEIALLDRVTAAFHKVIVILNLGNVIDLSWLERYPISALLLAWQGGMESGNAVADILCGDMNPCGKLSDTIARHYSDYPSASNFGDENVTKYEEDIYVGYRYFSTFQPSQVLYPFGFGLSYTSFDIQCLGFNGLKAFVQVTNTGKRPGKEVVQLYCSPPQGKLGKPVMQLCAFMKTDLLQPGQTQKLTLETDEYLLSSYDDAGKTGYRSAYVLEAGEYRFFIGCSVAHLNPAGGFTVEETKVLSQLAEACAPIEPMKRLTPQGTEDVPLRTTDIKQRILDNLPPEIPYSGDKGYRLSAVKTGMVAMDDFIAQLSDIELEALTRGEGAMDSGLGAKGNAGAFGGILTSLRQKGVPAAITTDGPSGVRLKTACSLTPCATALACTWNPDLVQTLMEKIGEELIINGSSVLLGPGMNIHRDPLCGRNFEYYSEDPLLSGKMAASAVKGIQSGGVSACPKHFSCNNQEKNRNRNDSRVSERALREIYLKGFEICLRDSNPKNIMTSYNLLNGVWNHYNYELVTVILREEWGYEGNVITDWWMVPSESPEFPGLRTHGYRVRAQVDVFMPGNHSDEKEYASDGTLLETLGQPEGITRGELQRTAKNVLRFVMTLLD